MAEPDRIDDVDVVGVGLNGRQVLRHEAGCYELALRPAPRIDLEEAEAAVMAAERALAAGDMVTADRAATAAGKTARRRFLPGETGEWVDRERDRMEDLLLRALDVRAASAPPAEAVRCAIEAWRSGPCVRRGTCA